MRFIQRFGRAIKSTRRGLSLIEVMISTAISAILLTAAGAAYCASTKAIENNDRFFTASQGARVSMTQMMSTFRRCQAIQVYSDHVDVTTATGLHNTYKYVPASSQLQLVTNDTPANPPFVLARNITAASFNADMAPNPQTQILSVVRVAVGLTVNVNGNQMLLSGAAAPRCNVTYH
jgi:prepilin-type N-terminal cleavage/methylation domain-containing protein